MIDADLLFNETIRPDRVNYPKVVAILLQELEENDSPLLSKIMLKYDIVDDAYDELTLLSDTMRIEATLKKKMNDMMNTLTEQEKEIFHRMKHMGEI